jgi:hypothetical protein
VRYVCKSNLTNPKDDDDDSPDQSLSEIAYIQGLDLKLVPDHLYHHDTQAMTALSTHQAYLGDVLTRQRVRRLLIDPVGALPSQPEVTLPIGYTDDEQVQAGPSKANVKNYVPAEETIRNDYCAWYGVSGENGGEFILGAEDHEICEEYVLLQQYSA